MRPTPSIILFTVTSGAGFGLLFLLGAGLATGVVPSGNAAHADDALPGTIAALIAGALLAGAGLVASLGHLGKPLRAWRALSQWRTSWLSREGVASVATFAPLVVLIALLPSNAATLPVRGVALLLSLCSVVTVTCTAGIYSCLKPIRAWHDPHVLPGYLLFGAYSGALWLLALDAGKPWLVARWPVAVAIACLLALASALLKWSYWRGLGRTPARPSTGVATGLAARGEVSSLEVPHTEENYLLHEMGFVVARRHRRRLRAIAVILVLVPIAFLAGSVTGPKLLAWPALAAGMSGIFIERWLFFAEARHAVTAYYGR